MITGKLRAIIEAQKEVCAQRAERFGGQLLVDGRQQIVEHFGERPAQLNNIRTRIHAL